MLDGTHTPEDAVPNIVLEEPQAEASPPLVDVARLVEKHRDKMGMVEGAIWVKGQPRVEVLYAAYGGEPVPPCTNPASGEVARAVIFTGTQAWEMITNIDSPPIADADVLDVSRLVTRSCGNGQGEVNLIGGANSPIWEWELYKPAPGMDFGGRVSGKSGLFAQEYFINKVEGKRRIRLRKVNVNPNAPIGVNMVAELDKRISAIPASEART